MDSEFGGPNEWDRRINLEVQLWSREGIYLGDLGERDDWIWSRARAAGVPDPKGAQKKDPKPLKRAQKSIVLRTFWGPGT